MDAPLTGGDKIKEPLGTGRFGPLALVAEVVILVLYFQTSYDTSALASLDSSSIYNFYVGVALMMFVGFGYLMTFLKAYGLGAVGLTMLITCIGVQWAVVVEKTMVLKTLAFPLAFSDILNGNFAVAAVLISFGGLIGKIGPTQVLVVTLLELVFYCANKVFFLTNMLSIADCGGTIIIHVFGAYFGLAACKTLGAAPSETYNGSSYNSDLFSLIGTVFLWLFWPSFVAGGLPAGTDGHGIALLNTVLALLASTVTTFAIMPFITGKRLTTVPVQNATLAGGVSIGATANIAMGPFGATLVGIIAGAISCYGFEKPLIPSDTDTCGINNLHGMPGIFGGLVSVVIPFLVKDTVVVAMNQAIGLVGTLVVAIITGALTGVILKKVGGPSTPYHDSSYWEAADDVAVEA
jgi:ammonium transporter Rh